MNSEFWASVRRDRERNIRLMVRVFVGGSKFSEERISVDVDDMENVLPRLAEQHASMLGSGRGLYVEIEFLDELDPESRFFRTVTDPPAMLAPLAIDLTDKSFDITKVWGSVKRKP